MDELMTSEAPQKDTDANLVVIVYYLEDFSDHVSVMFFLFWTLYLNTIVSVSIDSGVSL